MRLTLVTLTRIDRRRVLITHEHVQEGGPKCTFPQLFKEPSGGVRLLTSQSVIAFARSLYSFRLDSSTPP